MGDSIDLNKFFEQLPAIIGAMDTTEKIVGAFAVVFSVVILISFRGMQPLHRGILTVLVLFGLMIFAYVMLNPRAEQMAQEGPTPTVSTPRHSITDGFIFPQSSERLLTQQDLQGLDTSTLAIARNEIFARKGRFFRTPFYQNYFSKYQWYKPNTWEPVLNTIEIRNIDLIKSFEAP